MCHNYKLPKRIHLIGIGGSGMHSLAEVLASTGCFISGSDMANVPIFGPKHKIYVHSGHTADLISEEVELVVYSDAIPNDNVELGRARKLGIPTVSYFEMLGQLTQARRTTAVAGTHGKSTVTAMTAHILTLAGLEPTVFCGARPVGSTSGGYAGRSDGIAIVEACEYRSNFLHLRPFFAAVLNIEPDHFDCFSCQTELEEAFQRFAKLVPPEGLVVLPEKGPAREVLASKISCRREFFGFSTSADWSASILEEKNGHFYFEIIRQGKKLGKVQLKMPGLHNVSNALAAAALAWANGASAEHILTGLASFPGLHRRLELLGELDGVIYIDDYAHHPTEVGKVLETVRLMYPKRRILCIFQPHQACRLARLLKDFANSLQIANKVWITDVFHAREDANQPGKVTADDLAREIEKSGLEVLPGRKLEEIALTLKTHLAVGDVLVTLGAGDIWKIRNYIGIQSAAKID